MVQPLILQMDALRHFVGGPSKANGHAKKKRAKKNGHAKNGHAKQSKAVAVIAFVKSHPGTTRHDLANGLKMNVPLAGWYLSDLKKRGALRRTAEGAYEAVG